MSWFGKLFNWILPEDPEPGCGYLWFKLPVSHPFAAACDIHDYYFGLAHEKKSEKTLDQADEELLWRWVFTAHNQLDPKRRCALMEDACRYWPLARALGKYLWDQPA